MSDVGPLTLTRWQGVPRWATSRILSCASSRDGSAVVLWYLVTYLMLPNLLFWLAGRVAYIDRPLVNIDYLLLGVVAGVLPRSATVASYTLLLLDDAFVTFTPVFHFDLETGLSSVSFALRLGKFAVPIAVFSLVSALVVASAVIALSEKLGRRALRPSLLASAILVTLVDVVGGTSRFSWSDSARIPVNVATSAGLKTAGALYRRFLVGRVGASRRPLVVESATNGLRTTIVAPHSAAPEVPNVVLVLVESLGLLTDAKADSEIFAPLLSRGIAEKYQVAFGTIGSRGATTSAELRELCGVGADYQRIDEVDITSCLPALLRSRGFRTVAVHGYRRQFFDREYWYPRLGFDELWFADELARIPGVQMCGAVFRGVCDRDAAALVEREIMGTPRGERRFVYWLTLNSHLPVNRSLVGDSSFDCATSGEAVRFGEVCALIRLQRVVLSAVAAMASNPKLPPTRFVIVGDHTAPFISRVRRALFVEGRVPFVELIPTLGHPVRSEARYSQGQ